jgi:hypothetical protein
MRTKQSGNYFLFVIIIAHPPAVNIVKRARGYMQNRVQIYQEMRNECSTVRKPHTKGKPPGAGAGGKRKSDLIRINMQLIPELKSFL